CCESSQLGVRIYVTIFPSARENQKYSQNLILRTPLHQLAHGTVMSRLEAELVSVQSHRPKSHDFGHKAATLRFAAGPCMPDRIAVGSKAVPLWIDVAKAHHGCQTSDIAKLVEMAAGRGCFWLRVGAGHRFGQQLFAFRPTKWIVARNGQAFRPAGNALLQSAAQGL